MSRRKQEQFQTINVSGAMLPPDLLRKIASLNKDKDTKSRDRIPGLTPEIYHLPEGSKLNEAIARSWAVLQAHWRSFSEAREQLGDDDTGTSLTNDRWLLPLFKELEYGRLTNSDAPVIDEKTYAIKRFYNHTPIHLIGCNLPLDKRTKGAAGAATASPHAMVQEYINRSDDHLWAFLSNGLQLRILRDNVSLSRQAYVEFDLAAMMDGEIYADFALLWLLCHQSRVEAERPEDCWLETWSILAREAGTRVLNDLRKGVANAISALGAGFIGHPRNDQLRAKLQDTGELSKDDFYRQLLRIVYRLLFLFVAEDRNLLHPPDADESACNLYDAHYSTRRLRDMSEKLRGSKHADLWHSLSLVFAQLEEQGCDQLGLIGLGSFLWRSDSSPDLLGPHQLSGKAPAAGETPTDSPPINDPVLITNDDLLTAIRALAFVEQDRVLRAVDYRNLGSEELGSVYESLLELHPVMHVEAKSFELSTAAGNERKTTGSYYTPDSLVQCLLDSALDPVVTARLAEAKRISRASANPESFPDWFTSLPTADQQTALAAGYAQVAEQALLALKVCDPACGSGHFLIAAAHRLARHLARVRTGETEPSPADYQRALRDVISRSIYGVDINPMAVELCKVSLWMEAIDPGRPLTFLDHRIQCGNSLLGTTPALLTDGIPDDAFKPIEGDVKAFCSELKRDNKKQRKDRAAGQGTLFDPPYKLGNLPASFARLSTSGDDTVTDVAEKERLYASLVSGADYLNARLLADTWCSVFVWKKDESDLGRLCPTENDFRKIENNPHSILPHVGSEVRRLADQYQFFHWHLAFPDVFVLPEEAGQAENEQTGWSRGFDVVLGNPPWERIKLQEKEWFAERAPEISNANARDRRVLLDRLSETNPDLMFAFLNARRMAEGESHLVRDTARYPLCGRGDVNTYAIFAELNCSVVNRTGGVGCIVPSGIATDDTTKLFFQHLCTTRTLTSVFDFENRDAIFDGVHRSFKFALLTVNGIDRPSLTGSQFVFFAHNVQQVSEPHRRFELSASDISLINPNTRTCPVFRSRRDAELTKLVYRRVPALCSQTSDTDWNATFFKKMIDVGIHADLITHAAVKPSADHVGVYEAKMIWHFDHRAATYDGVSERNRERGNAESMTLGQLVCPNALPMQRTWVTEATFRDRMNGRPWKHHWFLSLRDVTNTTNERTAIFAIRPFLPSVDKLPSLFPQAEAEEIACLAGALSGFAFDYIARQKVGGTNLGGYIVEQLPFIRRSSFAQSNQPVFRQEWILPRVLELTYTAWDLDAFALDCGYDGPPFRWDEERRFLLRCELDAAYFHLYLGSPSEWGADNPELREMFPTPRDAVDYIMETFPIVKRKDIKRTTILDDSGEVTTEGHYITRDTILRIYDQMAESITTGQPYQTQLQPPPGPPTDEEGNFIPLANWDEANWPRHVHQPREAEVKNG